MTSLSHHIDVDWLREAYRLTRKDGAVGVDEQTAAEYAAQLESNLESLLDRAKSGDRYRAPPVRRVHIPKGDGSKTRPIGIPTFEDKVLQRAVTMALEAVYEQDFLNCSYGFRPGRGAHDALDALWRYADDAVAVFELEEDARRVLAVLPKRFGKYGLRLHPEKTRLLRFHRPKGSGPNGDPPPAESFDLLGFTHFWGRSRKGNWVIQRKTASSRLSRAQHRISMWCRLNRHLPIKEQHAMLRAKLRGHDAYYGITGNGRALSVLRYWVTRDWFKWLRRRSRAAARLNWEWMDRLLRVFPLPPPRVVHSALSTAAKP